MIQFDEHIFQKAWKQPPASQLFKQVWWHLSNEKRAPWLFEEKKGMKSYPVMSSNPGL